MFYCDNCDYWANFYQEECPKCEYDKASIETYQRITNTYNTGDSNNG